MRSIKNLFQPVILLFSLLLFISCQKEISDTNPIPTEPTNELPDLSTKVSSSVSGFVTDENDAPVLGAIVTMGAGSFTTDKYGYFEIKNKDVVKNAAVVTVSMNGYFKGIKTYIAEAGKSAFFRIKLIPKTTAGTFSATAGGEVTSTGGLKISFPADAIAVAANGSAYTGTVNVAASWINPTAADLSRIMPGDLRGLDENGGLKSLTTYGMAAVEMTGAGGELLQIVSGKKATMTMPIPTAILASAPASIPLWSFDETKGLWKQEGSASKTGNTYVGDVSHFSFWNCDVPNNYVHFDCTVLDNAGAPVPFAFVKISVVGSPYNAGYGYTDSTGYTGGAVPNNAQLLLEVYSYYGCGTALYSQNFSTTSVNVSLGNITLNTGTTDMATITGTVTSCSQAPVTNGYIIMLKDGQYYRQNLNSAGEYELSTILCNTGSAVVSLIAEDIAQGEQSIPLTYTLVPGNNAVPNIQACGVSTSEFINYTIDGVNYSYTPPSDSVFMTGNGQNTNFILGGFSSTNNNTVNMSITNTGIALNSLQPVISFQSLQVPLVPLTSVSATITEYGAVGQFIAGNFTGTFVTQQQTPPVNYTVTCSFRVRRTF